MPKDIRSTIWRYALAIVIFAVILGLALLLMSYGVTLNFTIVIAAGLVAASWWGGRGPGLLMVGLLIAATVVLNPPGADASILRLVFGYFSVGALLALLVMLVSGRKITENKLREQHALLEAALEREQNARREAESASRLKDEFLATVSHELRTPLNAILGWAGMLSQGGLVKEAESNALEVIQRNARVQNALISDILDVSRIVTGKMRIDFHPVDLVPILNAAIDTIVPAAQAKSIELATDFPEETFLVNGDAERLQQVFWNLLSNAVKFTPSGGRVEVLAAREGEQIDITVSDTGVGIRDDFIPFVFDRFRQKDSSTKRTYGGLGLGLSIVRSLVELHGGSVHAASGDDTAGSTFMVTLPAAPADASAKPAADARTRRDLKGTRVLIVDDEPDTLEMLAVMMENFGADVRTARSSAEGIETFCDWKPDVIVSDIGMPGEDGMEMLRKIRALPSGSETPAAALTAYVSDSDREAALAAGFQMHIAKPVEPVRLADAVFDLTSSSSFPGTAADPGGASHSHLAP